MRCWWRRGRLPTLHQAPQPRCAAQQGAAALHIPLQPLPMPTFLTPTHTAACGGRPPGRSRGLLAGFAWSTRATTAAALHVARPSSTSSAGGPLQRSPCAQGAPRQPLTGWAQQPSAAGASGRCAAAQHEACLIAAVCQPWDHPLTASPHAPAHAVALPHASKRELAAGFVVVLHCRTGCGARVYPTYYRPKVGAEGGDGVRKGRWVG